MDVVHDQLVSGHRFRVLTIVDTYSKVSPALGVGRQYRGSDVVETLEQAIREQGVPTCIRVDNVLSLEVKIPCRTDLSCPGF